jgi:phospholipid transport system substrate-binding protein
MLKIYVGALVFIWCVGGAPFAGASEITESLKDTIDKVIEVVSDEKLKKDKPTRREKLREIIGERFNYKQMVRRSLAKDWDKRSDQEKEEFIVLYQKLLENSYASKIENFSDEKINYVGEKVKGNYAQVKTEIVRKDGVIAVDYNLLKEDEEWMVYDFVIEGVSMVRNYRSQFSKIIRKDSYEVLVKKLSEKIDELEANNGKEKPQKL